MVTAFNTFSLPASGTTLSAANSGSTDGSTAFSAVTIPTGGTLASDNTHTNYGISALKAATGTTASTCNAAWTGGTVGPFISAPITVWGVAYLFLTANPTSGMRVIQGISATASFVGGLGINTTGHITGNDTAGTAQVTSTAAVNLNSWFRVEWMHTSSATVGQIENKLFNTPDSVTPTETNTSTANLNLTGGAQTGVRIGQNSATASLGPFWIGYIAMSDVGYIGPISRFRHVGKRRF